MARTRGGNNSGNRKDSRQQPDKRRFRLSDKLPRTQYPKPKNERQRRKQRAEILRRYNASPRGRFREQKQNARRRGIPWEMTFEEWCGVWERSGRWDQRGARSAGQYVMSRLRDSGPYSVSNVEIISHAKNAAVTTPNRIARIQFEADPDWLHVNSAEGIE